MMRAALPMVLLGLGCCLLSAGDPFSPQLMKATQDYYKESEVASNNYRKALAPAIATADKIEVCLIHMDLNAQGPNSLGRINRDSNLAENEFPILSYGVAAKILNRKILTPAEMKRLLPLLQATLATDDPGRGAMCHDPAHAILVWHGKELLFQSSICFKCGNFSLELPDRSVFVGLSQPAFQKEMEALMPPPEPSAKDEAKKKH